MKRDNFLILASELNLKHNKGLLANGMNGEYWDASRRSADDGGTQVLFGFRGENLVVFITPFLCATTNKVINNGDELVDALIAALN